MKNIYNKKTVQRYEFIASNTVQVYYTDGTKETMSRQTFNQIIKEQSMADFDGHARGSVNLNQRIEFKLSARGQKFLDDHNAKVRAKSKFLEDYSATKVDTKGVHSMLLHEAMRVFGGACVLGFDSPFENCTFTLTR